MADRNTTLRHPSAEVGPNAVLEGDNILHLPYALSRTRRSFLTHRTRARKGSLVALPIQLDGQYADGGREVANPMTVSEVSTLNGTNEDLPRDSGVTMGDSETRDEKDYGERDRKKRVLKLLQSHKG